MLLVTFDPSSPFASGHGGRHIGNFADWCPPPPPLPPLAPHLLHLHHLFCRACVFSAVVFDWSVGRSGGGAATSDWLLLSFHSNRGKLFLLLCRALISHWWCWCEILPLLRWTSRRRRLSLLRPHPHTGGFISFLCFLKCSFKSPSGYESKKHPLTHRWSWFIIIPQVSISMHTCTGMPGDVTQKVAV